MHLIFEETPIENSYSNCTILTLAWTPFYDDDLFRQFLRTHLHHHHQQQQQTNATDNVQSRSVTDLHQPPVDSRIDGQSSAAHYQPQLQQTQNHSIGNIPEHANKFTNEGRSDKHGWLAVGNINGVVGVALTKCSPKEEELAHFSDHDEEQQNEEKSPSLDEDEVLLLDDGDDLGNNQQSNSREIKLKKFQRRKRNKKKKSQVKTEPVLNHFNDPDNEAFRANHHLRGHGSEILIVKWNEPYQRLATVDSKGCIFIWSKRNGRFQIESPLNNRNKSVVDFDWSNDGETALICYIDSFVLVGSGYGQRYWHSMLNLDDYHITCGVWSPDDDQLIFGVSNGSILVIYLQNSELTELVIRERYPIRSMSWSMGSQQAQRQQLLQQQHSSSSTSTSTASTSSDQNLHHRHQSHVSSVSSAVHNEQFGYSSSNNNNNNHQPHEDLQFPRPSHQSSPSTCRPLRRGQPGSSSLIVAPRPVGRPITSNPSGAVDGSCNNSFVNTNYYHLNRINTAIRWRQQSTGALFNSNNHRTRHPIRQSSSNSNEDLINNASSSSSSDSDRGNFNSSIVSSLPSDSSSFLPSTSSNVAATTTHTVLHKNVLAVDFCDGTIQLYVGGLEDPDPRIITTNMKGLHMQWSHDGNLLAVAGFYTVSSLSLAATIIQRGCSGQDTKNIAECLAIDDESGKRMHPMVRPSTYYLNVIHFYTPQGNLRHSQIIKYCAHPVSALTWGHKDRRLFVATGPVLHSARVYTSVPALQILAKTVIKQVISYRNMIESRNSKKEEHVNNFNTSKIKCQCIDHVKQQMQSLDFNAQTNERASFMKRTSEKKNINCDQVFLLPLPMRLLQTMDNMFVRTLRCQVPTPKEARDFIWKVPARNVRLFCTLICYDSDYPLTASATSSPTPKNSTPTNGSDTNYILYMEYLGSLVPILKAKRIGHLKPEFVIFDPQMQTYLESNSNCKKSSNDQLFSQQSRQNSLSTPLKSLNNKQQRSGRSGMRFSNIKSRFRSKSAAPSLHGNYSDHLYSDGILIQHQQNNGHGHAPMESNLTSLNTQLHSLLGYNNDRQRQSTSSSYLDLSSDSLMARDNFAYDMNSPENTSPIGASDLLSQYYSPANSNSIPGRNTDVSYLGYPDPYQRMAMLGSTRSFRSNQYLHHYHAYDNLPEQNMLAKVKSNFWGTKFKIVGAGPLPETIATMIYKTSLLHLQPRQVCITIKDLSKVCSSCFRLNDMNDDSFISSLDVAQKLSTPSSQQDNNIDRDLNEDDSLTSTVRCSSSTVFLEVGDSLRIAPMSCTHRPADLNINQHNIIDSADDHHQSSRSLRHQRRHHNRALSSPSTSSPASIPRNNRKRNERSVPTSLRSVTNSATLYSNERSGKKRPSSIFGHQSLESSVESPSKKLAVDCQAISKTNSDEQIDCSNLEDDDDILTLFMDNDVVEGSDSDRKKGSTTSISMKISSRSSSINELFPLMVPLGNVDSQDQPELSFTNQLRSFQEPSTPTAVGAVPPLLSISTITKMIVDLSSKAARDDDMDLVDTSVNDIENTNVRQQQSISNQEEQLNQYIDSILPPTPPTPVHRPRRPVRTNDNFKENINPLVPDCSKQLADVRPHACEPKVKEDITTNKSYLVDWSESADYSPSTTPPAPPTPPKRWFTKKLKEHLRNSALSLNIGSSASSEDHEQQPLLPNNSNREIDDEDKIIREPRHRVTHSQPCTPTKSSVKRSTYANCEERFLQNVASSSSDIHRIANDPSAENRSGYSENKENYSLGRDAILQRRCQSTTKLVSKAFRQRLNYFDCTSGGVECNQKQHPSLQLKSRSSTLDYDSHRNNKYAAKVTDLNIASIATKEMENNKSQTSINKNIGGPNIDWYLREHRLFNKPPVWNAFSQVYQLDFGGRVTQESAKNFQIEYHGELAMQFGRIDSHAYTLDFQYPFNALQAMGVALASLTQRLK